MKNYLKWTSFGVMSMSNLLYGHTDSLLQALKDGTPTVQMRLRVESVDRDSKVDGSGLSLRTAVGYRTASFQNFSAYVELEDISILGKDDAFLGYDGYVLDGDATNVNESYLKYHLNGLSVIAGRQTIIHDNARHVGNVGWRMNDQTFDAVTLKYDEGPLSLSYNHVWQRNTIKNGVSDVNNNLLNVSYKLKLGKVSGYYYDQDYDDNKVDLETYGLRFKGASPFGSGKLLYEAEAALQSNGVNDADTNYFSGILGYTSSYGVTFKAGIESLGHDEDVVVLKDGADDGRGSFSTPESTAHAFNGWSDVLIPRLGKQEIVDLHFSVGGKVAGTKLLARYHDLSSGTVGAVEGSEIEFLAVHKLKSGPVLGAKAAAFFNDVDDQDVTKFWLWTELNF